MKRLFRLTRWAAADATADDEPTAEELWDAACRGDPDFFRARIKKFHLPVVVSSLSMTNHFSFHPDSPMWEGFVRAAPPVNTVCSEPRLLEYFWQTLPSAPENKRYSAEALLRREADLIFAGGGVSQRLIWPAVRVAERMYQRGVEVPPIVMEKVIIPKLKRHAEEVRRFGRMKLPLHEETIVRRGDIPPYIIQAVVDRLGGGKGLLDDENTGVTAASIGLRLLAEDHPVVMQMVDRMMRTDPGRIAEDHLWMVPWLEDLWGQGNFPRSWIRSILRAGDEGRLPLPEDDIIRARGEPARLTGAKELLWDVYGHAAEGGAG